METGPHDTSPLSDGELVGRFQRGIEREAALFELFQRHADRTLAFFRRRIGNREIAAEQNQELYLAVIQHLDGFRGEASFKTWLFSIAHRQLSHLRRRWRTHLDEHADELPAELDLAPAGGADGPEKEASRSRIVGALRRCLAFLSEVERAVIYGQYFDGVTLEEMSRRIGLTNPSGARAPLVAAQRKLRRCLARAGIGAGTIDDAWETGP